MAFGYLVNQCPNNSDLESILGHLKYPVMHAGEQLGSLIKGEFNSGASGQTYERGSKR